MILELIIKGTKNNNVKTIEFPINKDTLINELQNIEGTIMVLSIKEIKKE